jgi:hypothetical protein
MRKLTCGGGEGISRLEIHPANPSDLHTRARAQKPAEHAGGRQPAGGGRVVGDGRGCAGPAAAESLRALDLATITNGLGAIGKGMEQGRRGGIG